MAQLIINGKKYGPHPFVVPLRDLKTREPLPGRTIGDIGQFGALFLLWSFTENTDDDGLSHIGPKVGYLMTDNGFLLLDHVRM